MCSIRATLRVACLRSKRAEMKISQDLGLTVYFLALLILASASDDRRHVAIKAVVFL